MSVSLKLLFSADKRAAVYYPSVIRQNVRRKEIVFKNPFFSALTKDARSCLYPRHPRRASRNRSESLSFNIKYGVITRVSGYWI